MKKQFILPFLIAFMSFFVIGCDKDHDDNIQNEETARVRTILEDGRWVIRQYKNDGVDRTTLFRDYMFQFDKNNVLRAALGTSSHTGSWSVTADDDRPADLDLNLFFSGAVELRTLNEDWEIIRYTADRIELGEDYGQLDEDVLIFEKQ
ncbi:hypothetical protein [Sphingobacterium griseoflavum]|uniref:Lipocalin-like domain-containing protein n=1 Tax=Sphingobacterium griseoflavum TaxID=1474952 RepID=A0ABQ3I0B6_9SPHI|nr:hypothetical protein [Sphingobacterium griseoflavum]GHE42055.1 hypothetical protein GCM10017764_26620 [Sphingobacterium griseoflavum]